MSRARFFLFLAVALALGAGAARAQRPYIGYVYPAGGQQGTTFQIRLGGQALNELDGVVVSGEGVGARVIQYLPRLNNQELQLLREQLQELRASPRADGATQPGAGAEPAMTMAAAGAPPTAPAVAGAALEDPKPMMERLQERIGGFIQNPACASISNLAIVEVTIAPNAEPGDREIRLCTTRGVSNPLVFQVGTVREYAAPPMPTSPQQVLGKEAQALRKRGPRDGDFDVQLPCTVNGQLGPQEINRFHFHAAKGQRLVLSADCRHLIPYIADAVPGWFQAVLSLSDAKGRELAYDDDHAFDPDPVIVFTVPDDGDYTLAVHDAIYRGREDFIYRVSMGERPLVTSSFPLGGRLGADVPVALEGVNLRPEDRVRTVSFETAGVHGLTVKQPGMVSNRVPFAVDPLPAILETENNNTEQTAQPLSGSVIVDGRIDTPDDVDVFKVTGKAGESLVVEVMARRLGSPLDSFVTVTDAHGKLIGFNDDTMDLSDGVNTHHADSYLAVRLPENGDYFIQLIDRAHQGGPEYAYRLRISAPQPDFELRVVPSSLALRYNTCAAATVYVLRKDNYDGPVRLTLDDPPPGFTALPVVLAKGQTVGRLMIRAPAQPTVKPVNLTIVGTARIAGVEHVHTAVAAEDKMQAFLWRQLVPAHDFVVTVFDPAITLPVARPVPVQSSEPAPTVAMTAPAAPATPPLAPATVATTATTAAATTTATTGTPPASKQTFSRQQVAGRLRQLKALYEAGLLTDAFYLKKVAECETAL